MRSKNVLADCKVALSWAETAKTEQEFRIRWVALVALLRAVGHVLEKVDGSSDSRTREAIKAKWDEWQRERSVHAIFWEFIEAERNNILKQYAVGYQVGELDVLVQRDGDSEVFTLDAMVYKPLANGPYAGDDARDVAEDAIQWWEKQLAEISGATLPR